MSEAVKPRYAADFNVQITVYFDDDGNNDVTDQAYEAAQAFIPSDADDMLSVGLEIVGKPRLATDPRP